MGRGGDDWFPQLCVNLQTGTKPIYIGHGIAYYIYIERKPTIMTLYETVNTQIETTLDFLKTEKAAPLAKEFLGWHAGRVQNILVDMWEDEKVQAVLAKRQGQGQVEKEQLIEALELIEVVKKWAHNEGTTEEGKGFYMAGINNTIHHLEEIDVKHSTLVGQWLTFLVDVAEIVNEEVHQDQRVFFP